MNSVNRKPIDVVNVEIEFGVFDDLFFDLLVENIAFTPMLIFGKCADDAIMLLAR